MFPVGIRHPLRQALSSMGHENRYYFGFTLYGGLQRKRLEQARTILKISWVLVRIKLHGAGCISFAEQWSGQIEID